MAISIDVSLHDAVLDTLNSSLHPETAARVADGCVALARAAMDGQRTFSSVVTTAILATVIAVLAGFALQTMTARGDFYRLLHGMPVEVLACFSNPTLPQRVQAQMGLRPLAFGQDLRMLMHQLPPDQLAVEPAATLLHVRQALIRSVPRWVLFSGHTFMGALAFENSEVRALGRYHIREKVRSRSRA